jgi:hypothetical protein
VAAYSGHNCRATDAACFFNAALDASIALSPAEEALRSLLLAHRLLTPLPERRVFGAVGLSLLALPRGLPRAEATDTLLHEAMHGLFYSDAPFAAACQRFWSAELSEAQRAVWRRFLGSLGYDATHEELCINEFQARAMHIQSHKHHASRLLRHTWRLSDSSSAALTEPVPRPAVAHALPCQAARRRRGSCGRCRRSLQSGWRRTCRGHRRGWAAAGACLRLRLARLAGRLS